MAAADHASTLSSIGTFIGSNWFWILIFWGVIGSLLESVRDFFLDGVTYLMKVRHRHRMAELKARAKAAKQAAALELVPCPCQHKHITPVIGVDDKVVAWLCKNEECSEQLPASWAVRQEDLR